MDTPLGTIDQLLASLTSPGMWRTDSLGRDYLQIEVPWYVERHPTMRCPCPAPTAHAVRRDVEEVGRIGVQRVVDEPATVLILYRATGEVVHVPCQTVVANKRL